MELKQVGKMYEFLLPHSITSKLIQRRWYSTSPAYMSMKGTILRNKSWSSQRYFQLETVARSLSVYMYTLDGCVRTYYFCARRLFCEKLFFFFNFSLWFCFVVVTYYGVLYMEDTATEYMRLEFPVKPVTICLFPLNAEARHSARNFGIVGMEVPASTTSPWCSFSLDCIVTGASVHQCPFYCIITGASVH